MINCSHVGYLLGDSGAYDPLIFLKDAVYNVFYTISPSIILLIFTFYTRNIDY